MLWTPNRPWRWEEEIQRRKELEEAREERITREEQEATDAYIERMWAEGEDW